MGRRQRIWVEACGERYLAAQIQENSSTTVVTLPFSEDPRFKNLHLTIPRPTGNTHLTLELRDGSKMRIYGDGLRVTSETPSRAIAAAALLGQLPDFWTNALAPIGSNPDGSGQQLWAMAVQNSVLPSAALKAEDHNVFLAEPAWVPGMAVPLNIMVLDCPASHGPRMSGLGPSAVYRTIETALNQNRRLVLAVGWPWP